MKTRFHLMILCVLFGYVINASAESYVPLAESAYASGNIKQAIRYYQMELREQPESTVARVGLAKCYFRNGYMDMAGTYINDVLRRDTNNSEALLLLGKSHLVKKEWAAARDVLLRLINNNPDYLDAYTPLSSALYNLGEKQKSYKVDEQLKARRGHS